MVRVQFVVVGLVVVIPAMAPLAVAEGDEGCIEASLVTIESMGIAPPRVELEGGGTFHFLAATPVRKGSEVFAVEGKFSCSAEELFVIVHCLEQVIGQPQIADCLR